MPTAHVCSITTVAEMVGSNRIVPVSSVVSPVGNPELGPEGEKTLRRSVVEKALETLKG